jgi:hypothetical protein
MEYKLRNWLYYNWLSGDHLVEQAIHSIDMFSWAMGDKAPLKDQRYRWKAKENRSEVRKRV